MKKIYNVFFFLNIISGILIMINYLFIFNYKDSSIPLFCILILFYIVASILYIKNKSTPNYLEYIITSIYIIYSIFIFIFSAIYQSNNSLIFSIMYYIKYLIIPNIIYVVYNIIKVRHE